MKSGLTRKIVCWMMGIALILPSCAVAQVLEENAVKAAFVFNFIAFTEWQSRPPVAGEAIDICINADNPILPSLNILDGKTIGKSPLRLRRLPSLASVPTDCRAVFLSLLDRNAWPQIKATLGKTGMLTVSDEPDIGLGGAVIFLSTHNNRMVFEVDMRAAARSRLTINHRLMRLARRVR